MKCYLYDEDDFVDLLLDKYEERKDYYEYLSKEGSIMSETYKVKGLMFTIRNDSPDHESMWGRFKYLLSIKVS